jgi:hypothetical protein
MCAERTIRIIDLWIYLTGHHMSYKHTTIFSHMNPLHRPTWSAWTLTSWTVLVTRTCGHVAGDTRQPHVPRP